MDLQDYTIFRRDRQGKGGGVLIAVSKHLKARLLSSSTAVEAIAVQIGPEITLCCMYLQSCCSEDYLNEALLYLQTLPSNKKLIVTGDFNLPEINWECMSSPCTRGTKFCDCIFDLNLSQLVIEPTHNLGNTLDLVLSNNPDCTIDLWVDPSTPSDHFLITYSLQSQLQPDKHLGSRRVPCYHRADLIGLDLVTSASYTL